MWQRPKGLAFLQANVCLRLVTVKTPKQLCPELNKMILKFFVRTKSTRGVRSGIIAPCGPDIWGAGGPPGLPRWHGHKPPARSAPLQPCPVHMGTGGRPTDLSPRWQALGPRSPSMNDSMCTFCWEAGAPVASAEPTSHSPGLSPCSPPPHGRAHGPRARRPAGPTARGQELHRTGD